MPTDREDPLSAGRGAFDRCDWRAAWHMLRQADADSPLDADDLERVAESAMWLGEFESCIETRQRAFAARLARGDARQAASLAMDLCRDYAHRRRDAVALGWVARAARLLEGLEPCAEVGRMAELRAILALHVEGDLAAAQRHLDDALDIARLCGDVDLAAAVLVGLGTLRVRVGDVGEGLRLVDEAMTDAVTGRLGRVATARVYCNTISLCQALGDVRRAREWTDEALACASQPGLGDFPGDCRLHHAEITRLRGDWTGAESELRRAMGELERWDLSHVGQAWYELGAIALRRGDLVAAADAFDQSASFGKDPEPGLAALRLAQGKEALAAALLRAAAASVGQVDPLARGELLPVIVEAELACGDGSAALTASEELAGLAATYQTVVLEAQAAMARARVELAVGDYEQAVVAAHAAISLWRDAGAPYEAAQAQHLLADAANQAGDRAVAIVELEAALAVLTGLGAEGDVERAQRLRDRLGNLGAQRRVCRTFMFTDIVDSTRLVATMGDEPWSTVLRWHDETIRGLLAEHHGTEVKQRGGGDGFFAAFPRAADAIACAVAVQRRFAGRREAHQFAPDIRIGVHQADALLSGNDFAGLGVHEAARIAELAEAGDIVASATTVAAAGPVTATSPTDTILRGLAQTVPVQRIKWNIG
jgi:class 3 adenylate cyclase